MMLAVDATRDLPLTSTAVATPLTTMSDAPVCATQISLVPILRAGLGMLPGALALLPDANTWLLGLERDEESLEPRAYYRKITSPETTDLCLVLNPMLATGGSLCAALATLKEEGVRNLRYLGLVAAPEGIAGRGAEPSRHGSPHRCLGRTTDGGCRRTAQRLYLARAGRCRRPPVPDRVGAVLRPRPVTLR